MQVVSHSLHAADWALERVASAYGTRPMSVSMMSPEGVQTTSEQWPFAKWVAIALAGDGSTMPYLRNLALPDPLLQLALQHSPFAAENTACTLFAGADAASSELHSDGIANALLVVNGTKLVVMLSNTDELSCAETSSLNIVIAARAASGGFPRPPQRPRWKAALLGRGAATGRVVFGSLELHYAWLDAGAMLLIPRGWLHYARCVGPALSVTYWDKPPPQTRAARRTDALSSPSASADMQAQAQPPTPVAVADAQARLDVLPSALIQEILLYCFGGEDAADEAAPPFARARTVCRAACTCKTLRVAAGEGVWRRGYELHWGGRAAATAAEWCHAAALPEPCAGAIGPRWAQAYARMYRVLLGEEMRRSARRAVRALRDAGLVRSNADVAALLHAHHTWLHADTLTELLSASPSTYWDEPPSATGEGEGAGAGAGDGGVGGGGGGGGGGGRSILAEWLELLAPSLQGLSLEAALRLFLLLCRLPAEAPRIDRMFQSLAAVYCRENSDHPFADADVACFFCFSMLMLNTDLHSDAIPPARKMTADQFERAQRGINGGDLDAAFVHRTYASIKEREFAYPPRGS